MLLDIEARIGEFYAAIPSQQNTSRLPQSGKQKGRVASIKELGISPREAQKALQIHKNPEIVAKIKAQARENKDIVQF